MGDASGDDRNQEATGGGRTKRILFVETELIADQQTNVTQANEII
jgi:hypothetical protein